MSMIRYKTPVEYAEEYCPDLPDSLFASGDPIDDLARWDEMPVEDVAWNILATRLEATPRSPR